jgi:hemerythrin-like domain-containing protein
MVAADRVETSGRAGRSLQSCCHQSSGLQLLADEHRFRFIKRRSALPPDLAKGLDLTSENECQVIEDGLDLIRSYADPLHRGKEENILFTWKHNLPRRGLITELLQTVLRHFSCGQKDPEAAQIR